MYSRRNVSLSKTLHVRFAEKECGDHKTRTINTDAHLRATVIGNSVTLPVVEQEVIIGKYRYRHFVG